MRKTFLTLPALLILLAGCSSPPPVNSQITSPTTQQSSEAQLTSFSNKEGKFGFKDETGKIIIQPQFAQVQEFSEGLAAVSNDKEKWGFINSNGQMTIKPQFNYVNSFSEGLASVVIGQWDDSEQGCSHDDLGDGLGGCTFLAKKWGYIDETGKFAIILPYPFVPSSFLNSPSSSGFFKNGIAIITRDDIGGATINIDKQGKEINSISNSTTGANQTSTLNTDLDAIKNAIIKTIGGTNNFGEDRNITVQYHSTNLDIAYIGDENLTPTMSKDSLKMTDSFKILKAILPYLGGAKTVTLSPSLKANDRYGNTTYDTALRIKISTAVLNKINWNNTSSIDIQNIADSYWQAAGL